MAEIGGSLGTYRAVSARPGRDVLRRAVAAWLVWAVIAANAVVIVWLWVHGGNISGVKTWGEALASIGRITGLLSAYGALIQVLLLARLPWMERLAGFDRLTRWHRFNGKITLYLVLAHVVFITWGYQQMDRISLPSEINSLLTNYPGMIAATVGTGLFIVVVVSSLIIVRRKLNYELWYVVHITAYAAIALAWFHEIPTGNELVLNRTAADYWTSLYLATLALLVVFRLLEPALNVLKYDLRVAAVQPEIPGVVSVYLHGRSLARLHARPGQFMLWRFLDRKRWWQSHPFSLSAVPAGDTLRITVKASGNFSRELGSLRPGTRVLAEGPFGAFTPDARRQDGLVLVAGGIGITPLRAMLEEMPPGTVLLYRVLRSEDIVFRDELDEIAGRRRIVIHYLAGDHRAPDGHHLLSPQHLRELVPDIARREAYICGPPAMMDTLIARVRQAGVPARHIHIERFSL